MKKKKTTWVEKLNDSKGLPKIEKINDKMRKRWGTRTIVIPAPIEVDELMKKVPAGKLATVNDIRAALAKKHKATICCPMTTGIFAWVVAHVAEEQAQIGAKYTTPYWRTLKTGGFLKQKYPGGAETQKLRLEREGHMVVKKGKNYVVQNYGKSLIQI